MKVLKGYTENQHRSEASIVERYVAEECIKFCCHYIEGGKSVGLPKIRHGRTPGGKGTRGYNVVTMTWHEVSQAHLYILNNTTEVIPYIDAHKKKTHSNEPKNEHDEGFARAQ